ncbi:MAG: hypothetical protein ACOYB1_16910 [Limnohabitans sp.]
MPTWLRLWQKMGVRWARQVWGLAPDGQAWALVALSRDGADLWRVHTTQSLKPPEGVPVTDASWLSQALADGQQFKRWSRHRVNMGLSAPNLATGQMVCPASVPLQAWPAEVQLEVAQALNLPAEAVSFDFVAQALGVGPAHHIHWVGCARALIQDYQHWIGAAKFWRLTGVEPEWHAARRAAQALLGGLPSLLQQAPQDWQFRWGRDNAWDGLNDEGMPNAQWESALRDALASPAGPRLVAAGLALKAWT